MPLPPRKALSRAPVPFVDSANVPAALAVAATEVAPTPLVPAEAIALAVITANVETVHQIYHQLIKSVILARKPRVKVDRQPSSFYIRLSILD